VFACIIIAILLTIMVSIEAFTTFVHARAFIDPGIDKPAFYTEVLARITGVIDGYLFAVFMLIFGMGIYELFISKIDVAEHSEVAERILLIRSIDDLKDRLAKIVFLILIVKYFQYAIGQTYDTPQSLLLLAAGILLLAGALWLTSRTQPH
jgi:uncharacterized membrane protein YqhA